MSNLATIIKYTFKEQFFPYMPSKKLANYPKNYPGRILFFIWTYIFLGLFFWFFAGASGITYLRMENGQSMYFAMFGIILTLMLLALYIPQMISNFFKSKDIDIYKTMPISQGELYMGKLLGTVLSSFDFLLFFLIYVGVYFADQGFDLLTLLLGILNFFTLIIIPYALVTGLILLVLKFTNIGQHKKLIKNIGYILLFAAVGVIYYFSFNTGNDVGSGNQPADGFFMSAVEAFGNISNVFINSKLFGLALTASVGDRIKYTLILLGVTGLICFIAYKLADNYYYDALSETSQGRKAKEKSTTDANFKSQSQARAIFKRDIKNLFSNIVFLSQGITFVVIFGVLTITLGRQLMGEIDIEPELIGLFRFWVFMGGFLISTLVWTSGGFGQNNLSREHKSFYLFQTLPINPTSHYMGRFASAYIASEIFNLALAIVATIFLRLGVFNGILAFLGLSLGALLANSISMLLGTTSINVNWKKPEEIAKGGMKFLGVYILSMLGIFLIIVLYVFIMRLTEGNHNIASLVLVTLPVILSAIFMKLSIESYQRGFFDV